VIKSGEVEPGAMADDTAGQAGEQRKRADNIDTKCGLALAFAGAIIALAREDTRLMVTGVEPPPVRRLPRLMRRIRKRIYRD
jgi:hypothetical protein